MKQYSFIDLCQQGYSSIEIPLIQRDYALGREQEQKKRLLFLKALHKGVIREGINLDFVYGSRDEKNKFIPLDGQQRLTTLYLLHWYAAKHESIESDKWREMLSGFTYKTRLSASRFCENLISFTPHFDRNDTISAQIRDEVWFSASWEDDPTIASMLQVLDDIANVFLNVDNLWGKLCDERKITFFLLPLENMGITDDVYIKMNSRGKLLTDFEHFKAELTKQVGSSNLSLKVDKDWTRLLWPYRNKENLIDDRFLSYFHFVTDIISVKAGKERIKSNEYLDMLSLYCEQGNISTLEAYFDCWVSITDIDKYFDDYLTKEEYAPSKVRVFDWETNLFKSCCEFYESNYSIGQFLMLYAFVLRNTADKEISDEDFRRRLRILRNLVLNSSDELREDKMRTLMEDTEYLILDGNIEAISGFNRSQKDEELGKQTWCANHTSAEVEQLFQLEDHELLYGCTSVINLDDVTAIERLKKLLDWKDLGFVAKALLASGDYRQDVGWNYQLGNSNGSVWKELLHASQRKGFDNTQTAIKTLLSRCQIITESELKAVVEDYLQDPSTKKDWRYYFVKYPCILEQADYGKFRWKDGSDNYAVDTMRTNTQLRTRWDAILYAVSKKLQSTEIILSDEGGGIFLPKLGCEFKNREDGFFIQDTEGNELERFQISQTDGIDDEDRVEFALSILKEKLTEKQSE